MLCLIESVVLLTKLMGIVTPLILSIVVAVAQRLILYTTQTQDRIVQRDRRDEHKIVSYNLPVTRLYRTWASMRGLGKRKRGSPTHLRSRVKSKCNIREHGRTTPVAYELATDMY